MVSYANVFSHILHTENQTLKGPQKKESIEAFEYIREHTSEDAIIMFAKPRVLALYTDRYCLGDNNKATPKETVQLITKYHVSHILLQNSLSRDAIKNFISKYSYMIEDDWSNAKFTLYKVASQDTIQEF
ncbi:MAG: hypothetical protein U9R32_07375 [Bacteroidota bacterium]|nr:hypothetical protein [Bacteroidota bacterium]